MASFSAASLLAHPRGIVFADDIDRFVESVYASSLLRPLFKHEHGLRGIHTKRMRYFTNDDAVVAELLVPDSSPLDISNPADFLGIRDDIGVPVDAEESIRAS